jgi:formate hydrogenlyase subunit 6/NADH:ubiquinone oxidoreductase subunit I
MDRCIACLQCMRVCPDHCISIEMQKRDIDGSGKPKPYAVGFVIDDSRCMYCSLCVEVCPVNCIYHTEEFEAQAYNRLELARQFGERPVDPTVDPKPAVKKKKKATAKKAPRTVERPVTEKDDAA